MGWSISIREYSVLGSGTHATLVLRDDAGNVRGVINGGPIVNGQLADFSQNPGSFFNGTPLGARTLDVQSGTTPGGYWQDGANETLLYGGTRQYGGQEATQASVESRWAAGVAAVEQINQRGWTYNYAPPNQPENRNDPDSTQGNSNSVAATVAATMVGDIVPRSELETIMPSVGTPFTGTYYPGASRVDLLPNSTMNAIRANEGLPDIMQNWRNSSVETPQGDGKTIVTMTNEETGELYSVSLYDAQDNLLQEIQYQPGGTATLQLDFDPTDAAPWSQKTTVAGAPGQVFEVAQLNDNSSTQTQFFDPLDTQPWSQHTVVKDSDDLVVADHFGYGSALDTWFATHDLAGTDFSGFDEATAGSFVASLERAIYAGDAVSGGIEGIFVDVGPFRQFSTGSYDIDIETGLIDTNPTDFGTGLTLIEPSFGLDSSSWDNAWQDWDWQSAQLAFPVDTFDSWSFGDWWEPIILDLDGDGIDITPRDGSLAVFDLDGDLFDERTAWVGPGDGLLVLNNPANDLPSGVVVEDRDEIAFADTPGETDLEALRAYDTNANDMIDAGDARWSDFLIWIDTNGDGYSDPDYPETPGVDENEVFTLTALGITSISLLRDDQSFQLPDGSLIHGFSSFTRNGTTGVAADVALAYDPIGSAAPRERFFTSPTIGDTGGVFFEGEDGESFFVFRTSDWFLPGGNWAYDEPNNLQVGADWNGLVWGGIVGGAFADTITVSDTSPATADKWLYGEGGNDTITGGIGNDQIDGGAGTDVLNGGAGDDTIYFEGSELANVTGGTAYDTGILVSTSALTVTLASRGLEAMIANAGNDAITVGATGSGANVDGRQGDDTITGGTLGDVLNGGSGVDTINAGAGDDLVMGGAGADALNAEDGNDSVFGGEGNDTISGGIGNDQIDGGAGADSLAGDSGDDSYVVDNAGDAVTEDAAEGTDLVQTALAAYALTANVENLTGTSAAGQTLTGNVLANTLTGSSGNDTLVGAGGNDTMAGGEGDDTYVVEDTGDVTVENSGAGIDTVAAFVNYTLSANQEVLILQGIATVGTGNDGDNTLQGNLSGNALTLDGAGGNDTLYGSMQADTLIGGEGNDTLLGNGGFSVGEVAANAMAGGAGDDTYYTLSSADTVSEDSNEGLDTVVAYYDFTLGANIEKLILVGSATAGFGNGLDNLISGFNSPNSLTLDGAGGNDTVYGSAQSDTLAGGAGNDLILGLTGSNTMIGGLGDDTYYSDSATDTIVEAEGEGFDTVVAYQNITLSENIELLIVQGAATTVTGSADGETIYGVNSSLALALAGAGGNDTIYGAGLSDTISGGEGNDIMLGFGGANSFAGGSGDDQYYTTSASDILTEDQGGGTDTVIASYNHTLGAHFEVLFLNGGATSGIGNNDANTMNGAASGNGVSLSGLGGADTFFGSAFADTLSGDTGDDTLFGDVGDDTFIYNAAALGIDTISDFTGGAGAGDVIDVSSVFADFAAVQAAAAQAGANTVISIDASNKLVLTGFTATNLNADDFVF